LGTLHQQIAAIDGRIAGYANRHMKNIRFHGRGASPEELARYVFDAEAEHQWFDDALSSGASTKLEFSEQDIAAITERRVLARVVEDFLVAAVELCSADFLWHVPVLDLVGRSPGVTRYPGNGLDP
jgi:hypothetical protein